MGTLNKPGTVARIRHLRLAFISSLLIRADTAHHVKVDEHRAAGPPGIRTPLLSSMPSRRPLLAVPKPMVEDAELESACFPRCERGGHSRQPHPPTCPSLGCFRRHAPREGGRTSRAWTVGESNSFFRLARAACKPVDTYSPYGAPEGTRTPIKRLCRPFRNQFRTLVHGLDDGTRTRIDLSTTGPQPAA